MPRISIMRDQRVAIIIDGLGAGGAERTVSDIAASLMAAGVNTTVVYLQDRLSNAGLMACNQRQVPTLFVKVRRLWNLWDWLGFIVSIRGLQPNVLHAHLQYATIISLIVGALLRIRTVVTLHTLEEPNQWTKAGLRLRLMFALLKYLPCELICLTDQSKAIVLKYLPNKAHSIHVIPNGLNLSEWKLRQRRGGTGDSAGPMVMLSVAVLRKMKGIHHLIRAHAALSKRFPDLHLMVVGDGPERHILEREAELSGNGERVFFTGQRSDIRELMHSADLFVLPTLFDALPTVIIEAMAVGLPVVASRTGGIPEMISDEETGLLVEPGNEDELVTACERLIQSPQFALRLARAARGSVECNFDLNTQVKRLLILYGLRGSAS